MPINTMKIDRSYITNEDDGKITWAKNGAASYSVVNKDKLNDYGEAPGYRIYPSKLNLLKDINPRLANMVCRQR